MLTNKVQLINTVDACKALDYAAKLPLQVQVQGMLFGVNMFNVQNKSEKQVNLYLTVLWKNQTAQCHQWGVI